MDERQPTMRTLATGYGIIEGPVWDAVKGLYFSDLKNGGVYLLDRADKIVQVVPKRRGIGGIALHEAGGLVIGGRDIQHAPLDGKPGRVLLDKSVATDALGFNDLTTDRVGRVYAGALAYALAAGEAAKPGRLYLIDLDGSARVVADGNFLNNGLGFSPDGKLLYHSDTHSGLVRVYDVAADGSLGPWRRFASMSMPDGLATAADGSVWVADARDGRVAVWNADGSHRRDIRMPLPMVTSVCFGGDDLMDIYIVTGDHFSPPNSGALYRMRADVAGLPLAPARVALG